MITQKEIQTLIQQVHLGLPANTNVSEIDVKKTVQKIKFFRDCENVLLNYSQPDKLEKQLQIVEDRMNVLWEKADRFFPSHNDKKRVSFLNSNGYTEAKNQLHILKFILNK